MISQSILTRPKKKILNGFLKLINKKFFLIYNKRLVKIYKIQKKNYNAPVLINLKKIYINSDIIFLTFSQKKNFLYVYDLNHIFRIYTLPTQKKIRTFFLNLNIIFLQKSILTDHIIYALHTNHSMYQHSLISSKKIYLAIINLNECKYVNIIQLKNMWFGENFIKFIKKEKIIVLVDGYQLNILNFSWNYKKIYKKIAYNRIEICSIVSDVNSMIIGDRYGFLSLFRFFLKNSTARTYDVLNMLSIIKIRSWSLNKIISFIFILKKNEIFVNLYGSVEIIHLNYETQKKKKFKILNRKNLYIVNISIINKFDKLLVVTHSDLILFTKNLCRAKIFDFGSSNLVKFFYEKSSLTLLKKFNVCLIPLLSLSNSFFLFGGPSNSIELIKLNQNLLNFNLLRKNCFRNEINSKPAPFKLLQSDALGKTIFFLKESNCLSNLINYEIKLKKFKLIPNFGLKFKYLYFTKKEFQLSIDRKGKQIAVKLNNFYIRILSSNLFLAKKDSLNITLFANKKVTAFSMSDDGIFLALGFSNIVNFWKLFPHVEKLKTFSFDIEFEVCNLKFLSLYAEKKIVIYSSDEILLFNIKTYSLVWKFKFKIIDLVVDKWSNLFMIKTKYISSKFQKINETIVVFDTSSPLPLKILDPRLFSNKSILSFSFSYFSNFSNKKSFIYLDSFFTINKIFI